MVNIPLDILPEGSSTEASTSAALQVSGGPDSMLLESSGKRLWTEFVYQTIWLICFVLGSLWSYQLALTCLQDNKRSYLKRFDKSLD